MPKYNYVCSVCGGTTIKPRSVESRREAAVCFHCGGRAEFAFSAQIQLITDREIDKPANKYALGFSEGDRVATRKADDRAYDAAWDGAKSHQAITPRQALQQNSLNDLFPHR